MSLRQRAHLKTSNHLRLFFALWPEEHVRQQLINYAQRLQSINSGRCVDADNIHLTLRYIGMFSVKKIPALEVFCEKIQSDSFVLQLQSVGLWSKPQVTWVAPMLIPPALTCLQQQLDQVCQAQGVAADPQPYQPHVTLIRKSKKLADDSPRLELLDWPVSSFVLVESRSTQRGVSYEVLREWELNKLASDSNDAFSQS
ncbi:MAG: RNA 2',3'-cyclic phosphodiesterase [Gammaproteobacteria bacterium]|nr:RNA 2',3'-cyclic phosphodiesterase [Gammaproteobacteria bacterium]MDH5729492.1 RNA 2',3'-cyclic phosphodiesterase [Gammaproteobacteria bacterium]